ncbi:MAG: secretin N-terminal domain-containing protein [Opitutales bacterium]
MKTKIMNFKNVKPFAITTALIGSSLFGYWAFGADENPSSIADYDVATLDLNENDLETENLAAEPTFIGSLTLVNESLEQALTLLGQWTNKILVPNSNLPKVSINLDIQMPLTRSEAISVLKSALAANGIAVTPMGEKALRVIPSNRAKSSSPEIKDRAVLSTLPGSQEICSTLYRLNNLTAREAARIINPWVTPLTSSVVTLDKANSLLVTDALSNLQQLDVILKNIDKVGDVQEAILFFEVKNISADEMKKNFEELQKGALKCYLLGNTSFASDKHTNLFIAVTPKGNEALIRQFVAKFDVNVDSLTQHHVFKIQHGSCKDMTDIIKKLMQQQQQVNRDHGNTANTPNANIQQDSFSSQLSIECDERMNAIVAYGTPSDIRQIQNLVDQLDVVLPQVRIEIIIAEVKLTKGQASGLENFGYSLAKEKSNDHTITTKVASIPGGSSAFSINRLNFPKFGMDTALNVAKTDSNVSILSSPTLLTTHAREASLKITETRPYKTGTQTKLNGGTNADVANDTYERVDAGIELTVKPLIGTNGVVQLEIGQKVDNFSAGSETNMPHINRREAKSFISVRSGEMIVLGGLKQKEITDQKKRMFIFGDIPLLGDALFSSKSKSEEVRELIIFIRPYVLADLDKAKENSNEYKSDLEKVTQDEVNNYMETGQFLKRDIFETKKRRKNAQVQRPTLHGKRMQLRENSKK